MLRHLMIICLNRTFYGIEIGLMLVNLCLLIVLIVPFMELKFLICECLCVKLSS